MLSAVQEIRGQEGLSGTRKVAMEAYSILRDVLDNDLLSQWSKAQVSGPPCLAAAQWSSSSIETSPDSISNDEASRRPTSYKCGLPCLDAAQWSESSIETSSNSSFSIKGSQRPVHEVRFSHVMPHPVPAPEPTINQPSQNPSIPTPISKINPPRNRPER